MVDSVNTIFCSRASGVTPRNPRVNNPPPQVSLNQVDSRPHLGRKARLGRGQCNPPAALLAGNDDESFEKSKRRLQQGGINCQSC